MYLQLLIEGIAYQNTTYQEDLKIADYLEHKEYTKQI